MRQIKSILKLEYFCNEIRTTVKFDCRERQSEIFMFFYHRRPPTRIDRHCSLIDTHVLFCKAIEIIIQREENRSSDHGCRNSSIDWEFDRANTIWIFIKSYIQKGRLCYK